MMTRLSASLLLAAMPAPAAAQVTAEPDTPPGLVVLAGMHACCSDKALPEAERITAAELRTLGFQVLRVSGVATEKRERRIELGVLAEEKKARAALRIVKRPRTGSTGVEIWITGSNAGEAVFRQYEIVTEDPSQTATLIALRLVELLQVKLAPTQTRPAPASAALLVTESASMVEDNQQDSPATTPALALRLSPLALYSPGGVGPRGGLDLTAALRVTQWLRAEIAATGCFLGSRVRKSGEAASFSLALARTWLLWTSPHLLGVEPAVGAGAGVLWVRSRGQVSDTFAARTATNRTTYAGVIAQAGLPLSDRLTLRLSFAVGMSVPQISVRFGGRQVARFGSPLAEALLGLDMAAPKKDQIGMSAYPGGAFADMARSAVE